MDLLKCFLVTILVTLSIAGPARIRHSECSLQCENKPKFAYEIGKQYTYEYEAEAETSFYSTDNDDTSKVRVSAVVNIQPLTDCEFVLSLSDVQLHQTTKNEFFAKKIEKHDIKFSVQNGVIESVCGSEDDEVWITNFKKGILSQFQNSMKDLKKDEVIFEKDISGFCETKYTTINEDNGTHIIRSKTPSDCSSQANTHQTLSSFGFSANSYIQDMKLLTSTQECTQHISEGIMDAVICEEMHDFQPFNDGKSGALTQAKSSLRLKAVLMSDYSNSEIFASRSDLEYEAFEQKQNVENAFETAQNILNTLAEHTEYGIKKDVPILFSKLVSTLRVLSYSQITNLRQHNGEAKIKFIIDAIPLVNTDAAMKVFVDFILNGNISDRQTEVWLTSLAFIKNPNLQMISAVTPLTAVRKGSKALLGISSLVHSYCQIHENCIDEKEVQVFLRNIESHLGAACRTYSKEEEESVLYALKAVGNAGVFLNSESVLRKCYLEDNVMQIRLAAIDAWRRVSCSSDRSHFLHTFNNQYEDNEIRIASYLILMRCPNQEFIDVVKDRLTSEGVNQVASFVWSHLTNIQESAASEKQWIRHLIGEEMLVKKYNGTLKLSRNYESSFYLKEQEFGANFDSNVVFSSKSFIPRTSTLNLNLELFGKSINVFEVGGRVEGLEAFIEQFFGPDGYYPEETVAAIVKNLRQQSEKSETQLENLISDSSDRTQGSFFLKMLGNEILYKNFENIEGIISEFGFKNMFDLIMELTKKNNIDYVKNFELINSEFTYPTLLGFPIKLNVSGTATVGLQIDGHFKFENLGLINIEGKLIPSASVRIDSQMSVDTYVSTSGVKMSSSLHTSSGIDGKFVVNKGKLIDVEVKMPQEKMEIFDLSKEYFKIEDNIEIELTNDGIHVEDCSPVFCRELGIYFCSQKLVIPERSTALNGFYSQKSKLYLKNFDKSSSFVFHYVNDDDLKLLEFDITGSQTDKKWLINWKNLLSDTGTSHEFDIHTPHGSSKALLNYDFNPEKIEVGTTLIINDNDKYEAIFNANRKSEGGLQKLASEIQILSSKFEQELIFIKLDGSFDQYTTSAKSKLESRGIVMPTTIAEFDYNPEEKYTTASLSSRPLELFVSGRLDGNSNMGKLIFNAKYDQPGFYKDEGDLVLSYEIDKESVKYEALLKTKSDIEINYLLEAKKNYGYNKIHGKILGFVLEVESTCDYINTNKVKEMKLVTKASVPSHNIEMNKSFYSLMNDEEIKIEFSVKNPNEISYGTNFNVVYGESILANTYYHSPSFKHVEDVQIRKLADKTIDAKLHREMSGFTTKMEGTLNIQILEKGIESKITGNYQTGFQNYVAKAANLKWIANASDSGLNLEADLNYGENSNFLNLEITKSRLFFDTNIFKNIKAEISIACTNDEKKLEVYSQFEQIVLEGHGHLTSSGVDAAFRFKDYDYKVRFNIDGNGMEALLVLSPKLKFALNGDFTISGNGLSSHMGIETPFEGWQNQEAEFNFNFEKDSEGEYIFNGKTNLNWGNEHHVSLTINFMNEKIKNDIKNYILITKVVSSIEDFKNIEFNVNYLKSSQVRNSVDISIDGSFNFVTFKGFFVAGLSDNGFTSKFYFNSPILGDYSAVYKHKIELGNVEASFELNLPEKEYKTSLKLNYSDFYKLSGTFECFLPYMPKISAISHLNFGKINKNFEIHGKYNDETLSVIAELNSQKAYDRDLSGKLIINATSNKLLNLEINYNRKESGKFAGDFEIHSDLLDDKIYGMFKGIYLSIHSLSLYGEISSTVFKSQITLSQQMIRNEIKTKLHYSLNDMSLDLECWGNLNIDTYEAEYHGVLTSTYETLNDSKFNIQHKIIDNVRNTNLDLTTSNINIEINHKFSYKDKLNWISILKVNDYSIENIMDNSKDMLRFATNSNFGRMINFDIRSYAGNSLNIECTIETNWNSQVNIYSNFKHENIDQMSKCEFKLDYNNNNIIILQNKFLFNNERTTNVFTLFFNRFLEQSLSFEFDLYKSGYNSFDLKMAVNDYYVLALGAIHNSSEINYKAEMTIGKSLPLLKLKYTFTNTSRLLFVSYQSTQLYKIEILHSGTTFESGSVILNLELPCLFNGEVRSAGFYEISDKIEIEIKSRFNDHEYKLKTKIMNDNFNFTVNSPSGESNLSINWVNENFKLLSIEFTCPSSVIKYASLKISFEKSNLNTKAEIHATFAEKTIVITGRKIKEEIEINCTTNIPEWEHINIKLMGKDLNFEAKVSKNNDEIKIVGHIKITSTSYAVNLNGNLPINGYENNFLNFRVERQNKLAEIDLSVKVGSDNLYLNLMTEVIRWMSDANDLESNLIPIIKDTKVFKFQIKSTILNLENILLNASLSPKALEINGTDKSRNFSLQLTYSLNQENAGEIHLRAKTNFGNFESLTAQATIHFIESPYKIALKISCDDSSVEYFIKGAASSTKIEIEGITHFAQFNRILLQAEYKYSNNHMEYKMICNINEISYQLNGFYNHQTSIPTLEFHLTGFKPLLNIELKLKKFSNSNYHLFSSYSHGEISHKLVLDSQLRGQIGEISADYISSVYFYKKQSIKASYNIEQERKVLHIDLERDEDLDSFKIEGGLFAKEFIVDIETPFENYEKILIVGKHILSGDERTFEGRFAYNDVAYSFKGNYLKIGKGYEMVALISLAELEDVKISAIVSPNKVIVKWTVDGIQNEWQLNYIITCENIHIKIDANYNNDINNLEFKLSYLVNGGKFKSNIDLVINKSHSWIYFKTYENKAEINLFIDVPITDIKYKATANIDLQSKKKIFEIHFDDASYENSLIFELLLDGISQGSCKLQLDIMSNVNTYGLEYVLKDKDVKQIDIRAALFNGQNVYTVGLRSIFEQNKAEFKVYTPFSNYEIIGIESELQLSKRQGKLNVVIGEYVFNLEASLNFNDFKIHIITPFTDFNEFKISLSHKCSKHEKLIRSDLILNDMIYALNGALNTESKPQLTLKIKSPINILELLEIEINLDYEAQEKATLMTVTYNNSSYILSVAYDFEYYKGLLKFNITSPISVFSNIKFLIYYNFVDQKKQFQVLLEHNGDSRILNLTGTSFDETDFYFETPSNIFGNIKASGSYNRSKRSLEMRMMNDHHHGDIAASFNSLIIKASTPFKNFKDEYFEISKKDNGWFVDYKRNNGNVFFNFDLESTTKKVAIKIKSETPGWEILSLLGRIDLEESLLYLKGKKNSAMFQINGEGSLESRKGTLTIKTKSEYENYKEVTSKLEYNALRNILKITSKSSSSDYKIHFEVNRGIKVDVFVPNEEKNTVAKGKLTPFNGKLAISSRFPSLKQFSLIYSVKLGTVIKIDVYLEHNNIEIFKLDFERDTQANTGHLKIEGKRGENESTLYFHREGWNSIDFSFKRNDKEFKVDVKGSGDLPKKGVLDYEIVNSFRTITRTITGKLTVDRTIEPKELKLEVDIKDYKSYTATLKYNAQLSNKKKGDFVFNLIRNTRELSPYDNISGSWDIQNKDDIVIKINTGSRNYQITGKIGIFETNIVLISELFDGKNFLLQWKFNKQGYVRDHYLKIGREDRYVMLKLKGTINGISSGDTEGALRISRFMKNDLDFTATWKRDDKGLKGSGTFTLGDYSGKHELHNLKRNANERASTVDWSATSNVPNYNNIKLKGKYSLAKKVIDMKLSWDTDEIYIKGNLNNFTPQESENTLKFHLPHFGDGEINLAHDFNNPLSKSITVSGVIGGKKIDYIVKWERNLNFTTFDLNADIQSGLLGSINVKIYYDVTDFDDSKGTFIYKRNNDKFVNLEWSRLKTDKTLKDEMKFTSHFSFLPKAHIYLEANWVDGFKLDGEIKYNEKCIKMNVNIDDKQTTATLTTPYKDFEKVSVVVNYVVSPKKSTFSFDYERGDKKIKANAVINRNSSSNGNLLLTFISPFEKFKELKISMDWKDGLFKANYKRNDVAMEAKGTAKIKPGNSSFDISFILPSEKKVEIQFSYNIPSFIKGTGSTIKKLLHMKLNIENENLEFTVNGYRTVDQVYIEIDGNKSFGKIKTFYLKLDSELNYVKREGRLIVKANEFHLDMKNSFEKLDNGYYARSKIQSTLTDLPGLTVGFGRDGSSFIFSTGYGDEREVIITMKGKDNFRKGFSGTIDIPRRKIVGLDYNIDYDFLSENVMKVTAKIRVAEGEYIEVDINYDSDGVKGRLSSPWSGSHSGRMKRSIGTNNFYADIGFDDYGLLIESKANEIKYRKGINIQGYLFGQKISVNGYYDIKDNNNAEGKLVLDVPSLGIKDINTSFKIETKNDRSVGEIKFESFCKFYLNYDIDFNNGIDGKVELIINESVYNVLVKLSNMSGSELSGNITIMTPYSTFDKIIVTGFVANLYSNNIKSKFSLECCSVIYEIETTIKFDAPSYIVNFDLSSSTGTKIQFIADCILSIELMNFKGYSELNVNGSRIYYIKSEVSMPNRKVMIINIHSTICNDWRLEGFFNKDDDVKCDINIYYKNEQKFNVGLFVPHHLKEYSFVINNKGSSTKFFEVNISKDKNAKSVLIRFDFCHMFALHTSLELDSGANMNLIGKVKLYNNQIEFVHGTSTFLKENNLKANNMNIKIPTLNLAMQYNNNKNLNAKVDKVVKTRKIEIQYDEHYALIQIENEVYKRNSDKDTYGLRIKTTGALSNELNIVVHPSFKKYYNIKCDINAIRFGNLFAEGELVLNIENEYSLRLKAATPFENYESIDVGLKYIAEDVRKIEIYANPIDLKANIYFGMLPKLFTSGIELETGFTDLEKIEGSVTFPTDRFEPSFSANYGGVPYELKMKVNETQNGKEIKLESENINVPYDLSLSYKNKAPYEIDAAINNNINNYSRKFGIIFDSSILELAKIIAAHAYVVAM